MVLLAVERYLASRGTKSSKGFCRLNVQVAYMVISWVFCVAYNLSNSLYHKMNGTNLCESGQFIYFRDAYSRIGLTVFVPIMLSMTLVILLYSLTIANIRRTSNRVGNFQRRTTNMTHLDIRYVIYIIHKGLFYLCFLSWYS